MSFGMRDRVRDKDFKYFLQERARFQGKDAELIRHTVVARSRARAELR